MRNSQSPSIQSIYSNALPFYLDRVDLKSASEEGDAFVNTFFKNLFQGNISLQFDASNMSLEKVRHLYFESKNLAKTIGAKTFGFGYPLLIDTYESELIVAPLFIWQLTLEPAQTKVDAWVLKHDAQHSVLPNYQVVKYLKEKFDTEYTEKYQAAISNSKMSESVLNAFCKELADRFHMDEYRGEDQFLDAPGIDEIGEYTTNGAIHWSGVFGIYPPQNKTPNEVHRKPEDVFVDKGEMEEQDPFVFPYIAADPEQITALENSLKNNLSIVEGVDSLGKSQALLNLLMVSLMQGKKCLVVSERAPALKRIQDLLAKAGVNQLNFLLTDAINDRNQFLEILRFAAKGLSRDIELEEKDFLYKKNKFIREKNRLELSYEAIQKYYFGQHNWTDTVGLFISNHLKEGRELLANHLNKNDFDFHQHEYEKLKDGINKCVTLFAKVKTLSHPLSNLNDRVFQQVSMDEGKYYVEKQLKYFLEKLRGLHHDYISTTSNYRSQLHKHFLSYSQNLDEAYHQVNEKILSYGDQLGKDFLEAGPSAIELPSFLYSKKRKKIKSAQHDVAKGYKKLKKTFDRNPYFEFDFPSAKEGLKMEEVVQNLSDFQNVFTYWKNKLDDLLQEETIRLNSKTAHPSLGLKEEMSQLEFSLDVLLEELNDAKIYQKILENKTLTIPKRQKYLETIIEQLENTQLYLGEFPLFYQWQAQWLNIGEIGRKVIKALVKVKPKDWGSAFSSWYFYNLLEVKKSENLPTSLTHMDAYDSCWHELKPLLLNYINKLWKQKQEEGLKKFKKTEKKKYQEIFVRPFLRKKTTIGQLDEILKDGIEPVTDFLPVLFVNSHIALNILPKSFQFDLLIYEEANRFSIEPSTNIAKLGKQSVIFGSNDSNGNETSLLQYALESGVPSSAITNRYETPDQFLSKLHTSDHAFHFANSCVVENLEGRFHEMDSTNDFEAQQVIRILNQIKQTPQRIYPTVGIVAFTVEQRDLISSYILKLKQQNAVGSEKIRQLERNGMGIFYVEELYGQQFDIIILSCTFGSINLKEKLTKKLNLLNTQEGISYMQLLINMPLQKLYLLHSFTNKQLEKFIGKQYNKGTLLMAHYIKMAEAAQQENEIKYKEELEAIGKIEKSLENKVLFIQEVVKMLKPYVDPKRFETQVQWEDIVLPLVVHPIRKEAPRIVVHPDGFFSDTEYASGIWEKAHWKKLSVNAFEILPVWTVKWLSDPNHEARRLASQIIKIDGHYADEETNDGKSEEKDNAGDPNQLTIKEN